jgi:hypothetical protein
VCERYEKITWWYLNGSRLGKSTLNLIVRTLNTPPTSAWRRLIYVNSHLNFHVFYVGAPGYVNINTVVYAILQLCCKYYNV